MWLRCVSEIQQEQPGRATMPSQLPPDKSTVLFYSPHSSKSCISSSCLPFFSSRCIHLSVLLFKCSFPPFRRQVMFEPTVTMATSICIRKSAIEGANEMCNNMRRHSASLSKSRPLRHINQVVCYGVDAHICLNNLMGTLSTTFCGIFIN